MSTILLCTNKLSKSFGHVKALDGVTLQGRSKSILGLVGSNGAGKTTFIKCCCGLTLPSSGTVTILGNEVKVGSSAYRREIGAVLEGNRNVYHNLSIVNNLQYFGGLRGMPKNKIAQRTAHLLHHFDLSEKAHVQCGALSRGMQQMVSIMCALLHEPRILFLDEPTLGLDLDARHSMKSAIRDLVSDDTLLIVTSHDLRFISEVCTEVLVIQKGRIIFGGDIASIRKLSDHSVLVIKASTDLASHRLDEVKGFISADEQSNTARFRIASSDDIYAIVEALRARNIAIETINQEDYSLENLYLDLSKGGAIK